MNSDKATIKVYETKEKRKFHELYYRFASGGGDGDEICGDSRFYFF